MPVAPIPRPLAVRYPEISVKVLSTLTFLLATTALYAATTVAVLPLANLNEARAPQLNWIGESTAETLRESLYAADVLALSRDDREEIYRRLSVRSAAVLTRATILRIAESLDADQVVYGDYRVEGAEFSNTTLDSNLRITVHVIDLAKLRETAQFEQTGPLRDLSLLETRIARYLVRMLAPQHEMARSETVFLRDHPPIRVDAMESYVRALAARNPDQKTRLFTQAAHLDDHFTAPGFQLGRMAFIRKDYRGAAPWFAKVTRADSFYMEASFLLGICRYNMADYEAAARQFQLVAAEIPLDEVYNNLGSALSRRADNEGALTNFSLALEGDQADPDYWFNAGYSLWKQGKHQEAATKFRAVLDRASNDNEATTFLGRCLKGDIFRPGNPRTEGRERLKLTFEDSAFRQLQAELKGNSGTQP